MPGVLICEAMAQVGAIFAHNARGGMEDNRVFVLTGLDNVKFKRPVEPGDQLRMELTCLKRRGSLLENAGSRHSRRQYRGAGRNLRDGNRIGLTSVW